MSETPSLKRSLTLPLLTLYGLGTTLGAGIYVLTGKVAGSAGLYAPVSFLVALGLVTATALSFAELSARYPKSAGEAVYVFEGFHLRHLSTLVGLLVVFAALISSAALANGFVGYFQQFVALPGWLCVLGLVVVLGLIAAWGILESVTLVTVITLVEVAGLALIVWVGRDALGTLPVRIGELLPPFETGIWLGILSGAVLAFYAFIGFEDMVNVAEEVQDAPRTMPRAIILTLILTGILYVAVALVAVLAMPLASLAAADAPLAAIYEYTTGRPATAIGLIGIVSVLNGALIQVILASRVLYGLGSERRLPTALSRIHPFTRTPLVATAVATALVMLFAQLLSLVALAQATTLITLVIFVLVNAALWRIKARDPRPEGLRVWPRWLPALGAVVSAAFLGFQLARFAGL
jgi:basic amino acid/polyamine antiporter, APA family